MLDIRKNFSSHSDRVALEISLQEGRQDSLEMKIGEWKDIFYLLLLNVSCEGDNELACTQLCTQLIHQLVWCSQDTNTYPVY